MKNIIIKKWKKRFVALPLKVAELSTPCAAKKALKRIHTAQKEYKGIVGFLDLEDCVSTDDLQQDGSHTQA